MTPPAGSLSSSSFELFSKPFELETKRFFVFRVGSKSLDPFGRPRGSNLSGERSQALRAGFTLGYLPWKPDPRPSTRPRDFFTKLIKPRDRRLFYGFWLQKAGVSVAADTTNTQHKCKLRRRLQIEQRRWAAQRKGGAAELVFELIAAVQQLQQRKVQPLFSRTSSVPPPFDMP